MATPILDAHLLREFLDYDRETGIFTWKVMLSNRRKPGDRAGNYTHGYVEIGIGGRSYRAHRLAWLFVYGEWPTGMLDHIDGDRANNAIMNLRDVTNQTNAQNRHEVSSSKVTSQYLGVTWNAANQCWMAQIGIDGKNLYVGQYATEHDAYIAYLHTKKLCHEDADICNRDLPPMPQRLKRHRRTSEVNGVSIDRTRNKWCAKPLIDGKRKHIGYFDTEADAIAAVMASQTTTAAGMTGIETLETADNLEGAAQ